MPESAPRIGLRSSSLSRAATASSGPAIASAALVLCGRLSDLID